MVVVSSGSSTALTRGAAITPATPAAASPLIKRRLAIIAIRDLPARWASRLQLAFEFVEEAPFCAVGNDLLRVRFDHADFVQAQGVEPDRVLGVKFPPFVVGDQCLKGIVVRGRKAAIDD